MWRRDLCTAKRGRSEVPFTFLALFNTLFILAIFAPYYFAALPALRAIISSL
jgi:hypothetical protein